MSQTLFLKDKTLYIRISDGEYEVNNPEIVGKFGLRILGESFILRYPLSTKDGYILLEGNDEAEWPGGIEKVCSCECQVKPMFCFFDCQQDKTIRIRLLPKEEKKAESAYKEFEGKDLHIVTPESSEPHEDRFNQALREVPQDIKDQVEFEHNAINEAWELWGNIAKKDNVNPQAFVFGYVEAKKKYAVPAPSESQEEIWKKHIQQEELWDDAISIGESEKSRKSAIHKIMKYFTITRNP